MKTLELLIDMNNVQLQTLTINHFIVLYGSKPQKIIALERGFSRYFNANLNS